MTPPPLPVGDQQRKDTEHLTLLAFFHFAIAALCLGGIGFLIMHYSVMNAVLTNPELLKAQGTHSRGGPTPADFMRILSIFYVVAGAVALAIATVNVASGLFLRKRRHRMFSLIVAGLNCLQVPFGTALGVTTLVVLQRESIRQSYLA